jgi:hypothetical protein
MGPVERPVRAGIHEQELCGEALECPQPRSATRHGSERLAVEVVKTCRGG